MILENPAFYLHQLSVYLTIIAAYSFLGFCAGYSFAKSGKRISEIPPVVFARRIFAFPRKSNVENDVEEGDDWETRIVKREVRMIV